MTLQNKDKIILDLCGGTGAWSKPYRDAGYDVRLITLPDYDVRWYKPPRNVYGILMAVDCTHFAGSGTTLAVAKSLGHIGIGYELSEDYLPMIKGRLQETPAGELGSQLRIL